MHTSRPAIALLPLLHSAAAAPSGARYYVSPRGSDARPGTRSRPFATLARARDAVRVARRTGKLAGVPVTVMLRGGRYRYDVDMGFYTNRGRGMLIEDNLFLRCGKAMGFGVCREGSMFQEGGAWKMVENLKAVRHDQPPYVTRHPALQQLAADFALGPQHLLERERPKDNVIRRNVSRGGLFLQLDPLASLDHVRIEQTLIADDVVFTGAFDGSGKGASYRRGDPVVAAELGKRGNIVAEGNLALVDPDAGDFRLRRGSPAWRAGFRPPPVAMMGLQTDEYRRHLPLPAPLIRTPTRSFVDGLRVTLSRDRWRPGGRLHDTLDGSDPTPASPVYRRPLRLLRSTTLKAIAERRGIQSPVAAAEYRCLRFEAGAGLLLSALEPEEYFGCFPVPFRDTNHAGGKISIAGRTYAHGLMLHPQEHPSGGRSWAVYALNGSLRRATRLTAVVGIEDEMHRYELGSATFGVEVLRDGSRSRVFESQVVRLGQSLAVRAEVAGAAKTRLFTTDAGDGIACDHATWADPKLE